MFSTCRSPEHLSILLFNSKLKDKFPDPSRSHITEYFYRIVQVAKKTILSGRVSYELRKKPFGGVKLGSEFLERRGCTSK